VTCITLEESYPDSSHPSQQAVLDEMKRFNVIVCGGEAGGGKEAYRERDRRRGPLFPAEDRGRRCRMGKFRDTGGRS
jgi:hypothetical protein